MLLRRPDNESPFREHPSGLNAFFTCFATVVIHECFQTSREDHTRNQTSSYVDLSVLYGEAYGLLTAPLDRLLKSPCNA